jgi:DNA-binding MarR family transcriptional regulator
MARTSDTTSRTPLDSIAVGRDLWEHKYGTTGATAMEAVSNLVRVHEIIVNFMDKYLADCDMTFGEYDVLAVIGDLGREGMPLGKIGQKARQFFNHQTSITNVVSRLADRGLVTMHQDHNDGRVTLVTLTPTGVRRLRKANQVMAGLNFGLDGLSETEQRQLTALLFKVRVAHGDARR